MGRWSGAQINTCLSKDRGRNWSRVERLTLSPLCNFSELVRNRPIPLTPPSARGGEGWCVPLYQELIGKFPELLWLKQVDGRLIAEKSRMAGGCATLQPSLIPINKESAVALLRDWTQAKRVFMSRTKDGGQTWSRPVPTNLPNPDAGISGLLLSDGRLILAFNDSIILREKLSLALSDDLGASWKNLFLLEHDADAVSSYPFMKRTSDGLIRMVYTHEGDDIKMLTINESWIAAQPGGKLEPSVR
jgi:predicted neuraminidase